jgi:hypothetical protein
MINPICVNFPFLVINASSFQTISAIRQEILKLEQPFFSSVSVLPQLVDLQAFLNLAFAGSQLLRQAFREVCLTVLQIPLTILMDFDLIPGTLWKQLVE